METTVKNKTNIREELKDIILDISWAKVAKRYFGRSPSWIYHKIDGIGNNGKEKGFSEKEKQEFKNALYDLSERTRKAADSL